MNNVSVEKWGFFELHLKGRSDGNPFTDYSIFGTFCSQYETKTVSGFYDGDDEWVIRFMPSFEGEYSYEINGSFLYGSDPVKGSFTSVSPRADNHGPIGVFNKYHLAYADGTPHYSFGTTCYDFVHQSQALIDQTFSTLESGYFNKIRFCIFPKHYDFCLHDPEMFPYEGTPMDAKVLTRKNFELYRGNPPGNSWNFKRFNLEFFRRIDKTVMKLMDMGMEADLILFHAYDRWGFSQMSMEDNLFYIRYIAARYSAFRNVWWALANEYELLKHLKEDEWDLMAAELMENDPYGHLRSIHNCEVFYDYSKPWITHCSCQRIDHHKTTEFTAEMRDTYGKPVIWDEVGYEGNIPHCWGNFIPEDLVRRAWEAIVRGGYCGHSETYLSDDDIIWWAHGGVLKGKSAERFGFMKDFLSDIPGCGLKPLKARDDVHFQFDDYVAVPEDERFKKDYYLFYYSVWRPAFRQIYVDDETEFDVDIVDTWNMNVEYAGRHKGRFEIPLGSRQYMGIRLRKVQ